MRSGPSKTDRTEANKMDAGSIFVSRGGGCGGGPEAFLFTGHDHSGDDPLSHRDARQYHRRMEA